MDLDAGISLVPPHVADLGRFDNTHVSDQPEEQLGVFSAAKVLADAARIRRGLENVHTFTRRRTVSTGNGLVSTAGMAGVSTTSGLVSTASMAQEVEINIPSPVATKDKAEEWLMRSANSNLQNAEWEDILARVAADKDLVQQLQAGEKYSEEDLPRKLVELVNQIKDVICSQRAEAKEKQANDSLTDKRLTCQSYIKNTKAVYSIKKLKLLYFEQVKEIFETIMRRVQSFVLMDSELEDKRLKRASQEGLEEPAKRQKIREASGSVPEQSNEESKADELSQEQLQQLMIIVLEERMNVKALHTKYPIID
ncbi:hypothetical protein Tco_1216855 [Tanacetum coccineum]